MDSLSHRRRGSSGSKKLLQDDCDSGRPTPLHDCLVEDASVDQMHNHGRSPCNGTKTRLKDVYDGLVTSKELLKVMGRVCHIDQQNSTTLSLFSALKFELDRACTSVGKLILDRKSSQSDLEVLLKHFEKEKAAWKMKEQDRIRAAVKSVVGELNTEKKLRRQTEGLNKRLGRELADTKAALSKTAKELESEKRTRDIMEQVCNELARVLGDDRAEVEELKKQSEQVRDELEKEREMLQLADVLREERVQMKLSEAKYHFEEKNAVVDELRSELQSYLKSKREEEHLDCPGSLRYDKIKELEKYLRETLPGSGHDQEKERDGVALVNEQKGEEDDNGSDIELNMDDISKSFQWSGDTVGNESKKNSANRSRWRKLIPGRIPKQTICLETNHTDGIEWELIPDDQGNIDALDTRGMLDLESSQPRKRDVEDDIERYNMIKDLRDRIASDSTRTIGQQGVSSNDPNGVACQG